MLPQRTSVLIIGAGPTGLATAISLINQGCHDITIVDAALTNLNSSRAMTIHAATLEALDTVGCADPLIQLGIKGKAIELRGRTSQSLRVDLSSLTPYTRYPYVLILPQNITEKVLEGHLKGLGVHVQRPYKLVGLKSSDVDGSVNATFESGEAVTANFVVGADGARSATRQLAGVGFADPDGMSLDASLGQFVLADVTFSPETSILPSDEASATAASGALFLVLPLPNSYLSEGSSNEPRGPVYRIGFSVPASSGPPPASPSTSYLQQHLDKHGPPRLSSDPSVNPTPIWISETLWSTRFRTHAAIADRFLIHVSTPHKGGGIIFLVGDAAHIHSPAGGLGMNLGIRDAIGLGSAVAEHIKLSDGVANGDVRLLDNYALARHSRALDTIRLTKRIMSLVNAVGSTRTLDWQYWFLRLFGSIPAVGRMIAWRISGLGNR